jgi:hypothetical protein
MEHAGLTDNLHELLRTGRPVGGLRENAWYALKAIGQLGGYISDIERAWRLARDAGSIGLQTRYALYLSSVRGINVRLPARLLELCLQEQVLSWPEALDSVRLQQDPVASSIVLSRLARLLPMDERDRVLETAFDAVVRLDDETVGAPALLALSRVLPDRLIGAFLTTVERITLDRYKADILVSLHLSDQHIERVVGIAKSIHDPLPRVQALAAIAQKEPIRDSVLTEIRDVISNMDSSWIKIAALCELAQLDPEQRQDDVDQAFTILSELDYSDGLAPALVYVTRQPVSVDRLNDALELAERTYREEDHPGKEEAYIATLALLGPLLNDQQRKSFIRTRVRRLEAAEGYFGQEAARRYVPILASYLPEGERDAALAKHVRSLVGTAAHVEGRRSFTRLLVDIATNSESLFSLGDWRRAAALNAVAQLPQNLVEVALEAVDKATSHEGRADVLGVLVRRLPQGRRVKILRKELQRVRGIHDQTSYGQTLAAIADHAPPEARADLAEAALEATQTMSRHERYFQVIASLCKQLPTHRASAIRRQALNDLSPEGNLRSQALALAAIIPCMTDSEIPETHSLVSALGKYAYLALAPLVPRLPPEQRQDEITKVLSAVQGVVIVELPNDFVAVLRPIAPHLDNAQVMSALTLIEEIHGYHDPSRADAVIILGPYLRTSGVARAVSITNRLKDGLSFVRATASLVPRLSGQQRTKALRKAIAKAKELDKEPRSRAFAEIAPLLADPTAMLSAALAAAMTIDEDDRRAQALSHLLRYLAVADCTQAYESMLRSCLGMRVTSRIGSTVNRENIDRAFMQARIADSAGTLAAIGGEQVVMEVARAMRETAAWWP